MTNLKDINFGMNQYCGPSALSAFTGKSTDECAAVISGITGAREIRAVDMTSLIKALEKLRFDSKKISVSGYTLFGTLTSLAKTSGLYLVTVPKHVIAIEVLDGKIYLVDNASKTPLPAEGSARLTQRVEDVWKVIPRNKPLLLRSSIEVTELPKHIYIHSIDVYEDERDNVKRSLGYLYFRDNSEFEKIMFELNNFVGKR